MIRKQVLAFLQQSRIHYLKIFSVLFDSFNRFETHEGRVLSHEGAGEEPPGKDVHPVVLEGLQEAKADLGAFGDLAQAHASELALSSEVFAERTHSLPALATGLQT